MILREGRGTAELRGGDKSGFATRTPADIRSDDGPIAAHEQETRPRRQRRRECAGVKPLKEFQSNPIYAGDLHRADMAWSKHAAGCGLAFEQIKDELLNGRDLGKEGSRKRQMEYEERTARKATEQCGA